MRKLIVLTTAVLLGLSMMVVGGITKADALDCGSGGGDCVLKDGNTTVKIDPSGGAGMYQWKVGTIDHMEMQWFWFRTDTDEFDDKEYALDTQDLVTALLSDTNGSGDDDFLFLRYVEKDGGSLTDPGDFIVEIKYSLTGGATPTDGSDMGEVLKIVNKSGSTLAFTFFQYTDFDFGGTPGDDTVTHTSDTLFTQTDPLTLFTETTGAPTPDHWETALVSTTKDKLTDANVDNLSDGTSPKSGNVSFAWQWDFSILNDKSVEISKDKLLQPIPEPATMLLLGSGLLGLMGVGYRRKRRLGLA